MTGRTTPPSTDPKPGRNPGYAEPQPRDRDDVRRPEPSKPGNPDDGGLGRKPETDSDPATNNG